MGKSDRKKLIVKLDKVFGDWIKQRDNYTCVVCGKTKFNAVIQCGHLYSRVNHSTRWDEENCYAQCSGCNLRHEHEFEPFRRVVESKLGKERLNALWFRHGQVRKYKEFELKELIKKYEIR